MPTLVCLGFGYCARHYVAHFGGRFERIVGTTRTAERAAALAAQRFGGRSVEMLVFDGKPPFDDLAAAIAAADAILVSAAPGEAGDPFLAVFGDQIARAPRLAGVVLSVVARRLSGFRRRLDRRNHARSCAAVPVAAMRGSRPSRHGRRWASAAACRSRSCGSAASMVRARTACCGCCAAPRSASPSPATSPTAFMSTTSRRRSTPHSRGVPTASSTSWTTSRRRRANRSPSRPSFSASRRPPRFPTRTPRSISRRSR